MSAAELAQALAPLRAELLRAAQQDARETTSRADSEAAQTTAAARNEAAGLLAAARAEGRALAAAQATAERVRTGREARGLVLTAQRDVLSEFRTLARRSAGELRGDPALLSRLRELATARAGPGAVATEHPDGGYVAEAPGRRADASLPVLVDRVIDDLGAEVERLWLP